MMTMMIWILAIALKGLRNIWPLATLREASHDFPIAKGEATPTTNAQGNALSQLNRYKKASINLDRGFFEVDGT
jgi:hypothetical protein